MSALALPAHRVTAVGTFLETMLAGGPTAVSELETKARAAGLLGELQRISDAKRFKREKRTLGIRSVRDGFGASGEWLWQLPAPSGAPIASSSGHLSSAQPVAVTYEIGHSGRRPSPECAADRTAEYAPTEPRERRIPIHWIEGVARLYKRRAPIDIPMHWWRQFLGDCANFLDPRNNWAGQASNLGWDTQAIFGCCRSQPLGFLGVAGLLWVINGGKLTELHRDWAVVEPAADGSRRIHHRRHAVSANITLPWRLR
jgi:hypothetical protein